MNRKEIILIYVLVTMVLMLSHTGILSQPNRLKQISDSIATLPTNSQYEASLSVMRTLLSTEPTLALQVGDIALKIASLNKDSLKYYRATYAKAFILYNLGDLKSSQSILNTIETGLSKSEDSDFYGRLLNLKGLCYLAEGQYEKALEAFYKFLTFVQKDNNYASLSIGYNNIGLIYFRLGNEKEALFNYNKCLTYKKMVNDTFDLDLIYFNMGLCVYQLDKPELGLKYADSGFMYIDHTPSFYHREVNGYFLKGVSFKRLRSYDSAIFYFKRSLVNSQINNMKLREAESYLLLGDTYFEMNKPLITENYYDSAAVLCTTSEMTQTLWSIHNRRRDLYKIMQNDSLVNKYSKLSLLLGDSLMGLDIVKGIQFYDSELNNFQLTESVNDKQSDAKALTYSFLVFSLTIMLSTALYFINKRKGSITR